MCFNPCSVDANMVHQQINKFLHRLLLFLSSKVDVSVLLCSQTNCDSHGHVCQQHRPRKCHQHGE